MLQLVQHVLIKVKHVIPQVVVHLVGKFWLAMHLSQAQQFPALISSSPGRGLYGSSGSAHCNICSDSTFSLGEQDQCTSCISEGVATCSSTTGNPVKW